MKISIIIAVLQSYDIIKRQLIYFIDMVKKDKSLMGKFEMIIIDDGSEPSIFYELSKNLLKLENIITEIDKNRYTIIDVENFIFPFKIIETHDKIPWTQPRARNIGAMYAQGEYLLMTDIDHIITKDAIESSFIFSGDKMVFPRKYAILNEKGDITRDKNELISYGCKENDLEIISSHANTFTIKRCIFCDLLKGYDEKFCGKYGGDDTDLNKRYGELHYKGLVKRHNVGPMIYVFPDPSKDVKQVFHDLRRRK